MPRPGPRASGATRATEGAMVATVTGLERIANGSVTSAQGFRAGAVSAGVKDGTPTRLDVAAVVADEPGVAHAVFTQCQVAAAPVLVSRERIAGGRAQGIVLNSGNANACTGAT